MRLSDANQIYFTFRFRAFYSIPKHLRLQEGKYLNNFSGIAHVMVEQGLLTYDLCRFCSEESKRYTCHIIFYPCKRIFSCKDILMESFLHSLLRINRNDDILLLLSQVITNDYHPSPPPKRQGLYRKLHEFGLCLLQHGVFPQSLSSTISSDRLQTTLLASRIIKVSFSTLHRLWPKRCEIIQVALSGNTQLKEIINL